MKHIKTLLRFIGLFIALPFALFALGIILFLGILSEVWAFCEQIGETDEEKQARLKREWKADF